MPPRRPDNHLEVAQRLRLTRQALGLSQAELCRRTGIGRQAAVLLWNRLTGIGPAAWNNAETGDNRMGVDNAMELCRATGVTLDWIFMGHRGGLPQKLAVDIEKLMKKRR